MEKFWKIFWKLFGILLLGSIFAGIAAGIVMQSAALAYRVIQGIIAAGLGICGVIGFIVVPVEMYFEDRKLRSKQDAVE